MPWSVVLASAVLGLLLTWITLADLATLEIPDTASFALVVTGVAAAAWLGLDLSWHVIGALVWASGFALIAVVYRMRSGADGLGLGDAKLMAGAGMWLGLTAPATVTLLASCGGIAVYLLKRFTIGPQALTEPIAFGPFLCLSIWVVWIFGPLGSVL